jgi:hypothetical protein
VDFLHKAAVVEWLELAVVLEDGRKVVAAQYSVRLKALGE